MWTIKNNSCRIIIILVTGMFIFNFIACDDDDTEDDITDWAQNQFNITLDTLPSDQVGASETITLITQLFSGTGSGIPDFDIYFKMLEKYIPAGTSGITEITQDDVIDLVDIAVDEIFCDGSISDFIAECKVTSSVPDSTFTIQVVVEGGLVTKTFTLEFT